MDAVKMRSMSKATARGPVQELREQLARGDITPRAAAEAALSRANSNASHNVYLALDAERVREEADTLPRRFPPVAKPPLYGVPVSIKDCFDVAGFPTTLGSRFYAARNGVAGEDSAVASRLRSQGAIIIGKTHMHPLAYGITGENPDYGDCVQPRDARRLTGGSSSGAAASVQEQSALAAIGTDTGGSVRVPAALCGLAGYRASVELAQRSGLWRGGVHLAPTFDTLGWLFQDLRDAPLLAEALFDLRMPEETQTSFRIGYVSDGFLDDCDSQVLADFADWKKKLSASGATITPADTSYWEEAPEIYAAITAHEAAATHGTKSGGDFSHFPAAIAERLAWGASISAAEIEQFRARHARFRERADAQLREFDFFLAPCAALYELAVGADHTASRRAILRYTTPMSLVGAPLVTLPCASGAGVQLIGPRNSDARLLGHAKVLGARLAWSIAAHDDERSRRGAG
jgi:aspartyl-tRNA(Asn)/glutamyl-tRNA(Gln) amidotransferase subunit A